MNANVWEDALEVLEQKKPGKQRLTKDMINRRLRPEPEIIENILEALEEKIRHYYKLFTVEKKRRSDAEKNNYYLQEEIAKAYEILERNKVYTMKMEEKLKTIKNNQGSLIDTVRRIDLLYVQLDTLVQSFAGVCTQTAIDATEDEHNLSKKKHIIQMLLDYIYPCRTLDPRINALYGLLYYQTIGLLNNNDYISPPVPPIPPAVPSQHDGWLPPSHFHLNKANLPSDLKDQSFATLVQTTHDKERASPIPQPGSRNHASSIINNDSSFNVNSDDGNTSKGVELLGFDIRIGSVELKYPQENPKIVCVVRYDNETAYTAIQNSKRVTKSKVPSQGNAEDKFTFVIDSTININSLPPKKAGEVPNFKIDIHDVRGKKLVGTSRCSFVSERTLMKNAPWDIYSRLTKGDPQIIGKIYVTIFPYPSKAILPAHAFKSMRESDKFSYDSILKNSDSLQKEETKAGPKESQMTTLKKNTNSMYLKVDSNKETKMSYKTMQLKKSVQFQQDKLPPAIPVNKTQTTIKKGKKVMFKPYVSKKEVATTPIPKSNEAVKNNNETKPAEALLKTSKVETKKEETKKEEIKKEETKKEETKKEEPVEASKPKLTNTQMMINRFSKKAEEGVKVNKLSPWSEIKKNDLKKIPPKENVPVKNPIIITKNTEKSNEVKVLMKLPIEMKKEEAIKDKDKDKDKEEDKETDKNKDKEEDKDKDKEEEAKVSLEKEAILKKIQFAITKKTGIPPKLNKEKSEKEVLEKSPASNSPKTPLENKNVSSSKDSIKSSNSPVDVSKDGESKNKTVPMKTPLIKPGVFTKKGVEMKKILLKKEFTKSKIQLIPPKGLGAKSSATPVGIKNSQDELEEEKPKSPEILKKSGDTSDKSPTTPIIKKSIINLKSPNTSKLFSSSGTSKTNSPNMHKTKTPQLSKSGSPEVPKVKPSEPSKLGLPVKSKVMLVKKEIGDTKITPNIHPAKLMKAPQKAVVSSSNNYEKIDSDDIEIKAALKMAKQKALFIDKSKIKSTIMKKTVVKREIKKFVPKLKEPLV